MVSTIKNILTNAGYTQIEKIHTQTHVIKHLHLESLPKIKCHRNVLNVLAIRPNQQNVHMSKATSNSNHCQNPLL
jgi:hypothetical protein